MRPVTALLILTTYGGADPARRSHAGFDLRTVAGVVACEAPRGSTGVRMGEVAPAGDPLAAVGDPGCVAVATAATRATPSGDPDDSALMLDVGNVTT